MAKATRQTTQPAFVPVVLTLESQDEVDAIFAAMNFNPVCEGIRKRASGNVPADIREALRRHKTDMADKIHGAIVTASI